MFAPRFAALGFEVVISAPGSYRGQPLAYGDCLIIGGARDPHGNDVLAGDYQAHKADLLITLCDLFALYPSASDIAQMNAAHWLPVDTEPAGEIDIATLRDGGGTPIAISRFGARMLAAEGWLLAMERLKADPGVSAGELPAIAEGITALARALADGLQWPS